MLCLYIKVMEDKMTCNSVKFIKRMFCFVVLYLFAFEASAQTIGGLPANPWASSTATTSKTYSSQNVSNNIGHKTQPSAVVKQYANKKASGSDTSSGRWQGSGNYGGDVDYTGKVTTYDTAVGQAEVAPEVNVHNMLSMTEHMRKLGYKIPRSLDNKIASAPASTRAKIFKALNEIKSNKGNFVYRSTNQVMGELEKESGLSVDNLIGNSLRLMSQ